MFDNEYVYVEGITDSKDNPLLDSKSDQILSRTYTGLLKKFMEGIPERFEVSDFLRDNVYGTMNEIGYMTGKVLDRLNRPIQTKAIFIRKDKNP